MRIYISPKEEQRWILQPFRSSFGGAGREEKIRETAKEHDFRFLCVYPEGDVLHVAYTSERDSYDFASRFHAYCSGLEIKDVVYVERNTDDYNLIIVIRNGQIKQDKMGTTHEVKLVLDNLMRSGGLDDVRLINFQFLDNGFKEQVSLSFKKGIEDISAALTDKLDATEDFAFLPERDAMSKIKSRRPWLLYAFVFGCLFFVILNMMSPSDEDAPELVLDPYSTFYQAMADDVIQVLNRTAQDYNVHVGLMALPGWQVDRVIHTKGQVSYRMLPTEKGNIDTLSEFAEKNNLHVLIEPSEVVLLGLGANIAPLAEADVLLYDVEEVHHFLRDAINQFFPNAELTFIRDVPKGADKNKKWVIRELMFQFKGIYKEDLMTLGAITKDLPVSLGGDSSDPNAGQYIVDKERFTGGLKISVFGEKP